MERRREDLGRLALCHHFAAQHHGSAMGDTANDPEIMGDEEVGQAQIILQLFEQFQNVFCHQLVERRCRFIADDQIRIGRQRTSNTDTLLLAARKGCRQAASIIFWQADLFLKF